MGTKKIFLFVLLTAFGLVSCEEGENWNDLQTVAGLKQALEIGTSRAVDIVSQPGGYLDSDIHIDLPEDAQKTFQAVKAINDSNNFAAKLLLSVLNIDVNLEKTLTTLINSAAEDAAPQAVNVFVSTITSMTITDGTKILWGADNAATQYLQDHTYTQLQAAFKPSITSSLETVSVAGYTPNSAWSALVGINNYIADNAILSLLVSQVTGIDFNAMEPNLANYVTGKALDGLFTKVAVQELDIRTNVAARTTTLLQNVFGKLDK